MGVRTRRTRRHDNDGVPALEGGRDCDPLRRRLEREELDTYMDRLEASLAARPKTHFFVEVVDFAGLDMTGLGDALKRSGTYFRNLDRIGRVGIVADQS